ncbi:MAG TPA: hypothetical protein VGX97_04095 [bacterium]|nr:hypothetical protein [bacterium]
MAEERPAAAGGPAADKTGGARASQGGAAKPASQSVIYWRYLIFWLLFFGFVYFVTLYGIVAEA